MAMKMILIAVAALTVCSIGVHGETTRAPFQCSAPPADVVFVIDSSGSIGPHQVIFIHYKAIIATAIRLVVDEDDNGRFRLGKASNYALQSEFIVAVMELYEVGPDDMQFGGNIFGRNAQIEFDLDEYHNATALSIIVRNLEFLNSYTNIADGFRKANEMFDVSRGDRPAIRDLVVLITDGEANKEASKTITEADNLKARGIDIMCVGVTDGVKRSSLEAFATKPEWVIIIDSFDELDAFALDVALLVCEAVSTVDKCSTCSDFDNNHYGFAQGDNCYSYYVCKYDPETGVTENVSQMDCPIGTVYHVQAAKLGMPCVTKSEDNTCVDERTEGTAIPSEVCPWTTDPSDSTHFGLPDVNGDILDPQECQPGETFNDQDGFCRCMNQQKCDCILWIDFNEDDDDHSCNTVWVENNKPTVGFSSDSAMGARSGKFRGQRRHAESGAHLSVDAASGIFDRNCDEKHGQTQLTVATWFKYQYKGEDVNKISGLVTNCGDDEGPSVFMEIRGDKVCGGIKTIGNPMVEVCSTSSIVNKVWYYVSMVYDAPTLDLYVTVGTEFPTCGGATPGATCSPAATATQTGCVEPRKCSLNIGVSGNHWSLNQFFHGLMDEVQVSRAADYFACAISL